MSDWSQHLPDDELRRVKAAFVALDLCSDSMLRVVLSSVDKRYAATLASGPTPVATLQIHLTRMNEVANLRNGVVPLEQYLQAGIDLAGDRPEVAVLEGAMERITAYGGPSPVVPETPVAGPAASAILAAGAEPLNTDIEPEAMIAGVDDSLSVLFLQKAMTATQSVFRVLVHRHMDGEGEFTAGDEKYLVNGTGWMIGPRILITNHHVVNARRKGFLPEPDASAEDFRLQAENTAIDFDYLQEDSPSFTATTGTGALLASDAELDFALLRIPADAPERPPLKLRTRNVRKKLTQALGFRVNMLQHPHGNPMKLGFRENYVVFGDERILSYLTDTAVGSSGSPVTDDSWMVAALHAGSQTISDQNIVIRGRKVKRENFGIPTTAIMKKLESGFPDIYHEIKTAQDQL